MRRPRVDLAEFLLGVLGARLLAGVAWRGCDSAFRLRTIPITVILLLPTYLILVLTLRRHRKGVEDGRPLPDDR